MNKKIELFNPIHFVSFARQTIQHCCNIFNEHVLSSRINDRPFVFLVYIFKERKVVPVLFNDTVFFSFYLFSLQYDYVFCIILL